MTSAGPAVLIMARAPRAGAVHRALAPLLGVEGASRLQATLISQVARWAEEVAPGAVHVAHDPPDAAPELRPLVGDQAVLFPQNGAGIARRLADASARAFGRGHTPLLIVWPDLPQLRREHADAALSDLREGCDLVLGPVYDGGFYLVGLARPLRSLFTMPESSWRDGDVMRLAVAAGAAAGLELGLLRAERPLRRPEDVKAALADPCLPREIRACLGPGCG